MNPKDKESTENETSDLKFVGRCMLFVLWVALAIMAGLTLCTEADLWSPITESNAGLRLYLRGIHPEVVFKSALERRNCSIPTNSSSCELALGFEHTGLQASYDFNEQGHLIDCKGVELNNVNHFEDFPRQFLYEHSSQSLGGELHLKGPEDVDAPLIPLDFLKKQFDNALEYKNKRRRSDVSATKMLFFFTAAGFVKSLACLHKLPAFGPWMVLASWVIKYGASSDIDTLPGVAHNFGKWGLSLETISLPHNKVYYADFDLMGWGIFLAVVTLVAELTPVIVMFYLTFGEEKADDPRVIPLEDV